jgi:hypothetical protein
VGDVPVQYFQSVIAIELAVTGALLFQIRFFEPRAEARRDTGGLPDPRLALLLAVVLGATIFGSLWGILHHGQELSASLVTVGLAISLIPILLRVLPPLARDADTNERDEQFTFTVFGLILYTVAVAAAIVVLNL